MNGIIVVNKEKDYTSRDIVNIISKHFKTPKVGHAGTLDPLATGVLVICIGSSTKLVELITGNEKEYIAEVILGKDTDTLDITGRVLKEEKVLIDKEKIISVLKSMEGVYKQEVPIYSAIKVKGKKLYEYAREGKEVILPKKEVNIKKIELIDDVIYSDDKTIFKFKCLVSKGTYIRSLIRDIADKLNTVGCMNSLVRIKQGFFSLDKANTLDDIKNNMYKLYTNEEVLKNFYTVEVDDYLKNKIMNGCLLQNRYNEEKILFKDENGTLLAIYKVYEKDGTKIKPYKMFC